MENLDLTPKQMRNLEALGFDTPEEKAKFAANPFIQYLLASYTNAIVASAYRRNVPNEDDECERECEMY